MAECRWYERVGCSSKRVTKHHFYQGVYNNGRWFTVDNSGRRFQPGGKNGEPHPRFWVVHNRKPHARDEVMHYASPQDETKGPSNAEHRGPYTVVVNMANSHSMEGMAYIYDAQGKLIKGHPLNFNNPIIHKGNIEPLPYYPSV